MQSTVSTGPTGEWTNRRGEVGVAKGDAVNTVMIYTGNRPMKRTFEMACHCQSGWGTWKEFESQIEKRKPSSVSV